MFTFQFLKTFILKPFLLAALFSFAATPLVIKLARMLKLVDDPRQRRHPAHTHRGVIPRAGGLAIFIGLAAALLVMLPLEKKVIGILLGGLLIIIVGLLDDRYDLSPHWRFLTNFMAAGLAVSGGIGITYLSHPFGGLIYLDRWRVSFNFLGPHSILVWADIFALAWIVWCMNMVNWSKGVDGQMPGFVSIAAIVIGILSFRFVRLGDLSQWLPVVLSFATAGAFAGFLPFNFYPQKIMPGYGGGVLAGYFLAVLAILSGAKLATAILVLGVPLIDAGYIVLRRLSAGRSPVWGDRGHLHHKLMDLGWGKRRIAAAYWLVSAVLGLIALNLNSQQKLYTLTLLGVIMGATIIWLNHWSFYSRRPGRGKA